MKWQCKTAPTYEKDVQPGEKKNKQKKTTLEMANTKFFFNPL